MTDYKGSSELIDIGEAGYYKIPNFDVAWPILSYFDDYAGTTYPFGELTQDQYIMFMDWLGENYANEADKIDWGNPLHQKALIPKYEEFLSGLAGIDSTKELSDLEDESKKDDDTVIDEFIPTDPFISETVTPSTVIEEEDNMIYKPLGEDLAGFLADEGDRWTPANGFLDAASIVNPGQALVYGLGTIGGNVAQSLFDNAGMDVAITADRAKDKQYLNRYADLMGADLVMKDGKYMFGYTPEQAKLAGLQEASSGYTYNDLRQMIGLEPTKDGNVDVDNSFLKNVAEALQYEVEQDKKERSEYYSYGKKDTAVTGLPGSTLTGTGTVGASSWDDILLDTGTNSTTLSEDSEDSEDEDDNETFAQRAWNAVKNLI